MPGKLWRPAAFALALWAAGIAPALADGQLVVKSHPRGAAVFVDGRAVGTAPLVVNLAPGAHQVQARMDGYAPRAATVTVVDQLTTRTTLALERKNRDRGELRVMARPAGAQIYVNGRFAGQAPLYLKGLVPGKHRVVAVRDGFVKSVQRIDVVAGLTSTSFHTLSAVPARAAKPPAPRPTARVAVARPEPPRLLARAPEPRRDEKPAPVAPQAPEPPIALPEAPQPAIAPPALPLQDARPWIWPATRREIAFLLAMGALLAGLALYLLRTVWPLGRTAPVLFPARPPRGWLPMRGPAFTEASRAWQEGDIACARASLWNTVQAGAASGWHYYHLGLLAHREGQLAEAESAYRTAILLEPDRPEAGYNLGVLMADFEQTPQAILAYRKHLETHPDDVDALFNLGHLYLGLGMHQAASVHWTAARRLAPNDKALRTNLGFLLRVMRVQRRTQKRAA